MTIETSSVEHKGGGTSSKNTALVKPQVVSAARTMRLREAGGEGRATIRIDIRTGHDPGPRLLEVL